MRAATALKKKSTPEEYLAMERASKTKHQLVDGEVFAMAGVSLEHDLVAGSLFAAFNIRLRGHRCQAHTSDVRIHIPATGSFVYSDGFIVCRPECTDAKVDTVTNPCVVAEVLSPDSTEDYDRTGKFEEYKSIPTLRDYLLFSQARIFIEHFHRQPDGTWAKTEVRAGDALRLTAIPLEIPAEDLYPWGFAR